MNKHTPGPWVYDCGHVTAKVDGHTVFPLDHQETGPAPKHVTPHICDVNNRLAAAAPDLLAALTQLLSKVDVPRNWGPETHETIRSARAPPLQKPKESHERKQD